jgi:hypothetical protein
MRSLKVVICLSICTITALAVDRTKFRTCDQTSFCRRHRAKASESLYHYKLLPESLHFHIPPTAGTDEETSSSSSSLWKSFSSRILGTKGEGNKLDPYVRGAPPTLTGTLQNTAIQTEFLQWSVHAMVDGLVRIRIHEIYGSAGKPWEHARVTYDELILMEGSLSPAHHAQWIRPPNSTSDEAIDKEHKALLQKLIKNYDDDITNYTALQYGDSKDSKDNMILLIRLEPFTLFLYRESSLEVGPIITLNTQDMMHFEIRRLKNQDPSKLSESPQREEPDQEETKPEKEIVGYWEDGLAIYADGTREEKKNIEEEQVDEQNHRKLTDASDLDQRGMWEETFSSHTDSKPRGPMSVGMDISFPKSQHLYGIPEHASSTELKSTQGEGAHYQQPYRLYNLDVFEYELDETMALYGHVPLVVSHSVKTGTSGAFYFNPTETFVDVISQDDGKSTHWISESGIIDVSPTRFKSI